MVDAEPAMLPSAYPACCGGTKRPADAAEVREERLSALRSHSFTVLPVAKGGGIPRFGPLPVYAQFSYGFVRGAAVRFRTPARLHTGRGSFWDALTTAWVYSVRRRASGRYFSKTGEWPVLFEPARMWLFRPDGDGGSRLCGTSSSALIGRKLLKPIVFSERHVCMLAHWAATTSAWRVRRSACLHPGGLGAAFRPRADLAFAGSSSSFSPRAALAFRPKRGRLLLFAQNEDGSCFSPKNRYHIDIAKVRGAKAAFSTSGIECFRRRPRTFQASDFR